MTEQMNFSTHLYATLGSPLTIWTGSYNVRVDVLTHRGMDFHSRKRGNFRCHA